MAKVMGGMTVDKAREVFRRLMAKARRSKNSPADIMPEFRKRKLRSSSGRKVRSKRQAKAILLSELRRAGKIPPRRKNGLVDSIGPGDRVTILVPAGIGRGGQEWKQKTGRAVMRGPHGWVLNMGGAHGTPGIAGESNTVKVVKAKKRNASRLAYNEQYVVARDGRIVSPFYSKLVNARRAAKRLGGEVRKVKAGDFEPGGKLKNSRRRKRNDLDPRWQKTLAARQAGHERFIKRAMQIHHPGKKFADLTPFEQSAVLQFAHKLQMENAAGLKNPKRKRRTTSKRPRRKRNYADAEDLFEKFHGRKAGKVSDTGLPIADYGSHEELGQLGKLVSITIGDKDAEKPWSKKITWGNSEAPELAAEPGGAQLFLVGGNQNLEASIAQFPVDTTKDMLDLGFAYQIEYFTRKKFDDFQPVTYYHDLGEETGESPRAIYDRVKKRLHLVGGAYKVKPEGIVN